MLSAIYNLRLLHLLVHHVRFTRGEDLADFVDHILDALQSARPGSVFASLDDTLERHVRAIESASGLALPVPGYGPVRRSADDAFALTALAHGDEFWGEVRAVADDWRPLDAERAELLEYQQFVTIGPGDAPAERDLRARLAGVGRGARTCVRRPDAPADARAPHTIAVCERRRRDVRRRVVACGVCEVERRVRRYDAGSGVG